MADLHFYLDPICPFAWLTSRWVEEVAAARRYTVDWRFISLRIVNRDVDYDTHFPTGYEHGHTAGLRMLRVAAAVRADHGPDGVGRLYTGLGATIFDGEQPDDQAAHQLHLGTSEHVGGVLEAVGLPAAMRPSSSGTTSSASRRFPVSPSSSAASEKFPSCGPTAWAPTASASSRTGKQATSETRASSSRTRTAHCSDEIVEDVRQPALQAARERMSPLLLEHLSEHGGV